MTDRIRHHDQPDHGQQPSSSTSRRRDDDLSDLESPESTQRDRLPREPASVADDRGMDQGRRSFNGDREDDELGSEMEESLGDDDSDDFDDPDQSHR